MSEHNDKYTMEGDDMSQVRTIIKRLNEEAPSKEKSREVVVRADGTKVIRVTKKRRVMVTDREKRVRTRNVIIIALLVLLLCCGAFGAFYAYRMSMMSGESYLTQQAETLKSNWGVTDLNCSGAKIDGLDFTADAIVAEFPADSMIEKVELSGISAKLSPISFMTGVLTADVLSVKEATVRLRTADGVMKMPLQQGEDLWKFNRISCHELTVIAGSEGTPLMELRGTDSYLYYPRSDHRTASIRFMGGKFMMKGWKMMDIREGKCLLSANGVEDFSLRTHFAGAKADDGSFVLITGKLENGASLAGPFGLSSNRVDFAEFTQGRFAQILTAKTVASPGNTNSHVTVQLPLNGERPVFQGEFDVAEVAIVGMPALGVIRKHLERDQRRLYLPVKVMRGKLALSQEQGTMTLSIAEGDMMDAETVTLRGKVTVDATNTLSGSFDYGIPDVLATREYADGRPDPIFQQQGSWCWLNTALSGNANSPTDDSREQEARAEGDRLGRERLNLEEVDVDALIQESASKASTYTGASPKESPASGDQPGAAGTGDQQTTGWGNTPWQEDPWSAASQDTNGKNGGENSPSQELPLNPFSE